MAQKKKKIHYVLFVLLNKTCGEKVVIQPIKKRERQSRVSLVASQCWPAAFVPPSLCRLAGRAPWRPRLRVALSACRLPPARCARRRTFSRNSSPGAGISLPLAVRSVLFKPWKPHPSFHETRFVFGSGPDGGSEHRLSFQRSSLLRRLGERPSRQSTPTCRLGEGDWPGLRPRPGRPAV